MPKRIATLSIAAASILTFIPSYKSEAEPLALPLIAPPAAVTHVPEEPAPATPVATAPLVLPVQQAPAAKTVAAPSSPVHTPPPAAVVPAAPAVGTPVRLNIPAIGLNNPIVKVGTNAAGEMDVPSGRTNQVGWYSHGTVPGTSGSAVIGAHVYAAFANLHKLKVGDDVYVVQEDGSQLRFVVTDSKEYALKTMSADALFNRSGGKFLHLITCAGQLTADGSTYTHRRVIYATLAE